ncbi:MAG: 4a-hydroxytetrahydrobiopterin dehydratase [gamma proteobacterium symbiont of Taylorina sp.]|nr:4a-hydroxytetrahydrobiopterin dehydratase [gamma proteobacterium symbiont of Taylorina sp.]
MDELSAPVITTHEVGRISEKDFKLAIEMDKIAKSHL